MVGSQPRWSIAAIAVLVCVLACDAVAQTKGLAGSVNPEQQKTERALRWAILIGINRYADELGIGSLKYCVADISLLYEVLTGPNGGFERKNVLIMTDDAANPGYHPTYANIVTMVPRWLRDIGPDDDVLIAFSGHGVAQNTECYLLPSDARQASLGLTGVKVSQVRDWLESCRAKMKVLLLDACHSGAGKAPTEMSEELKRELEAGHGYLRLASCDAGQKSHESPDLGHGVFTYYLVEGLRGAADWDHDGRVGTDETYRYVCREVRRWARERGVYQDPLMAGRVVGGQLTLSYADKPERVEAKQVVGKGGTEIYLKIQPPDATVMVDGEHIPLRERGAVAFVRVAPGRHLIEIAKDGYARIGKVLDVPDSGVEGQIRLAPCLTYVVVHVRQGHKWEGELLSRSGDRITIQRGNSRATLDPGQYERLEERQVPQGEALVDIRPLPPKGRDVFKQFRFPPGYDSAFMIPTVDKDQHGNAIVTRNGRRFDPGTGWPYEIWLLDPRMEFVLISPGEFMMGGTSKDEELDKKLRGKEPPPDSPVWSEQPQHRVRITKPFYIGKYEVTNGQYRAFKPSHKCGEWLGLSFNGDTQPVPVLPWDDAVAFCRWLSTRCSLEVRLPTEAEWEYACRAGTTGSYYWGDNPADIGKYANVADLTMKRLHPEQWAFEVEDGYPLTAPVGRFAPNPWGLYDMLGNQAEWCADCYEAEYYRYSPLDNPTGAASGPHGVKRGGCIGYWPPDVRIPRRILEHVGAGFRCVVEATLRGPGRWEEDSAHLIGNWFIEINPYVSAGKVAKTNETGAYASFHFEGTGIDFISKVQPEATVAEIYLDGRLLTKHEQFQGEKVWHDRFVVEVARYLDKGQHELRIVHSGVKNPYGKPADLSVDGFIVYPLPDPPSDATPVPPVNPRPGQVWTNPIDGAELVWIPGGEFLMGADPEEMKKVFTKFRWPLENIGKDESPRHKVHVDGFWMYRYEVTVSRFQKFDAGAGYWGKTDAEKAGFGTHWFFDRPNPASEQVKGTWWLFPHKTNCVAAPNHPVVQVSWNDAQAYCKWAKVRLPTEAEWEFAARAGATGLNGQPHYPFVWGEGPPQAPVANFNEATLRLIFRSFHWSLYPGYEDGYVFTAPVGSYKPNPFGLHDMAGNVWEWCADWYAADYYGQSPSHNPQGPAAGQSRIQRGNAWDNAGDWVQVSRRTKATPNGRCTNTGFRCVRNR